MDAKEIRKMAHKFMLDRGYGKGTNFTTSSVSSLMANFALSLTEAAPKEEEKDNEWWVYNLGKQKTPINL